MTTRFMMGALLLLSAATAQAQDQDRKEWKWSGQLGDGRTVYLHNVNGDVRFEQGTGRTVEVIAEKRWRRGDPEEVRIEARQAGAGNGDVVICALWGERTTCDASGYQRSGDGNRSWNRNNDVSVHFVVRIPANARVDANTVNGGVTVDGTSGDIEAHTVNGSVEARSTGGRVEAQTVNGSITVRTTPGNTSDLAYETVNGSITIEIPEGSNVDLNLSTVNGRISTDFPITLDGTINPRRIRGSIGSGGPTLRASTVNGGIRLRKP
jgi:hypothetical protein